MTIFLRSFRSEDLPAVRSLIRETIDVSYAEAYPPRAVAFFKTFHDDSAILARAAEGTVLVAERDGAIVATGARRGNEILALFTRPDTQRGGAGKALMAALEDDARGAGLTEVTLSVSVPSKRFYEDRGYEITEIRSRDLGDGQFLEFWKARKRL
jgi:GNAT superfamily N-acetyltransferase